MRGVSVGTPWRVLLGTAAFVLLGCPGQELAPLNPCTVSAVSERVDQAGVSQVDLLFMIDNSGSMASKQKKLADQLPTLLQVLTSGDRCAGLDECTLDENSTPKRLFTPVKSLHLGVVTSNMGGIDDPGPRAQPSVASCKGLGDDGVLQNSTAIAVSGVIVERKDEFKIGDKVGDTLIAPAPECEGVGNIDAYQTYDVDDPDTDLDTVRKNFACVSRVGVRGCPFEQQLEAPWKALAPSDEKGAQYAFLNGTTGHGDSDNEGFLRDDAVLAVLLVTDEDDCSITDAGKLMFDQTDAGAAYGQINVRCGDNAGDENLIHPTSRYVEGLKALKPDNEDKVIFAAITGVPEEAIAAGKTPQEILELPAMQFAHALNTDGEDTGIPVISCQNANGSEVAYPPIRIVQVARDFEKNGLLYSVCAETYAPALNLLIEKIASKLTGNCLPRKLTPDTQGQVNCQVFELLPKGKDDKCDPKFGLSGTPKDRDVVENNKKTTRKACLMAPVSVLDDKPEVGKFGWYYDDFSDDVIATCKDNPQRIALQFDGTTDLPSGAGATFECFQSVARFDAQAKGFDAINKRCGGAEDICGLASNGDEGGYDLTCIENKCQVECKANPDCPPGWQCAANVKDGPTYCQLATCPDDSNTASSAPDAG